MEYVIDASVALKWFLPELHTGEARALLDSFLRGDTALCGPDILAAEVGNTLWKRSAGRGELSIPKARQCYLEFLSLGLVLESSTSVAEAAFDVAARGRHPLYDLLYVALAEKRGCPFITADQVLIRKLQPRHPLIQGIAEL